MHTTPLLPGLSPVAGRLSSDGGLIVLREIASRLGLVQVIAGRCAMTAIPHVSRTAAPRRRWPACSECASSNQRTVIAASHRFEQKETGACAFFVNAVAHP